MRFTIYAEKNASERRAFFYDNVTNTLTTEDGFVFELPEGDKDRLKPRGDATVFDGRRPLKKAKRVRLLKIQMGLSCNYGCEYCSQRFVARPDETTPRDVARFIEMLDALDFDEGAGLKIEFWGGEPFVYWKTFKPLAEAIRDRFENWKRAPVMSVITNGSLLTREINDWIVYMGLQVGISHDGPGQHVRGPDPLDDPASRAAILNLYKRLRPVGRISFNSMLNRENQSRAAIRKFFVDLTGDESVPLGEGGLIDAYDEGGLALSLTDGEHAMFRRQAFNDIYSTSGNINNQGIISKIDGFTRDVLSHTPSAAVPQKCGMDDDTVLAVDLRGNILTCQNTSAVATSPSGRSHLSGHITKIAVARVTTSRHWSTRDHCRDCPVLHICKGSCMYLEGDLWDASCNNSYSDSVVFFALSFEKMTDGFIPYEIVSEDPAFPATRRDIWGSLVSQPVGGTAQKEVSNA